MFRKTKLSSAVVIALATTVGATMLTGLTGCKLTEGGTSITGGQTSTISNPKGTVVGNVQDTNGNPLADVEIYLAGKKTKTDDGGNYSFRNIGVVSVYNESCSCVMDSLQVTVLAPAGYLGATVTVTPTGQMFETEADAGGVVNPVMTFIDGFLAQAGTAVLPAVDTSVSAVVRNELTGEPLANMTVAFDFTGVMVIQETEQDTIGTGYSSVSMLATTDADGALSFVAPADSNMRASIFGWTVTNIENGGVNTFNTNDEVDQVWLNTIWATPEVSVDDVEPFIASLDVVPNDGDDTKGQMHDDVTDTFVVSFSESMDASMIDANSLKVRDVTNDAWLVISGTPSLSADGKQLTIQLTANVVAGAEIHVHFLNVDFQDQAGNLLALGTAATGGIDYDHDGDIDPATSTAAYIEVQMDVFAEANDTADAVVLSQITAGDDVLGSDAFRDVTGGDVEQINPAESEARLDDLKQALGGTAGYATDVALMTFTPTNASRYEVAVRNADGDKVALNVWNAGTTSWDDDGVVSNDSGVDAGSADTARVDEFTNSIVTDGSGDIVLRVDGAAHGWTVEVTPFDDFDYAGASDDEDILDTNPPRPSRQDAYGVTDYANGPQLAENNGTGATNFGDGGETADLIGATQGAPYLWITPMLQDDDHSGDLEDELMVLNAVPTAQEITDGASATAATPAGSYDATALAAYGAQSVQMAVAMTENSTLSTTGPTATPAATAGLSGWTMHNNAMFDDGHMFDNGAAIVTEVQENEDIARFTVADVAAFANADHGVVLDFAGVLADSYGNGATAATLATVVVGDATPLMIESAVYNGSNMVITFDGPPTVDATANTMTLAGTTITLDAAGTNWSVTGNVMTVLPAAWGGDIDRATDFPITTRYAEAAQSAVAVGSNELYGHAALNFDDIEDANANSWSDYGIWFHGGAQGTSDGTPEFAMIDATGLMEISSTTVSSLAASNTAGAITVTFNLTHPIATGIGGFAAMGAGNTTVTETANTDLNADSIALLGAAGGWLNLVVADGTLAITNADVTAVYDSVAKTVVVTVPFTVGALAAGDDVIVSTGIKAFTSDWDAADADTPTGTLVTY